jgi:outer membrane receptor protein involved in Fe transport
MMPGQWRRGTLIIAGLGVVQLPLARAADAPSSADTLQEVIVTAERRAERALDVPASISVISAADIERLHATELRDLEGAVPGFTIMPAGSPGQSQIVVRGLPAFSAGALVATLIDDATVGSSSIWGDSGALDMLPYDIERIEILRGPQGTLYGANSMGGVLKYVTKDPNLTASEAQIGGEVFGIRGGGSLGTGVRGTWSAPVIGGTLAVRASLYDQESPGYIRNPVRGLNHENTLSQYGGRLAILWQPAAGLQVKLQGIYQRINAAGNLVIFADVLGTVQDPYYRPGNLAFGDLTYPHPIPEPSSSDVTFISGTLEWHLGFGDLVAVSSYSDKGTSAATDFTGIYLDPSTPVRIRAETVAKKVSQEFRFESSSGQRLNWLAGAYYTHEQAWSDGYSDALDKQLNLIPALNPFNVGHFPSTYSEAALFGTLTYRINERLDLTGGLRWLKNRQEVDQYIPPSYSNPGGLPPTQVRTAETPATYAFSARFRARPETMTYVRVASGYRPGTPNPPVPGYPEIPPLATSDRMVSYEIGVKSELLNRAATLDFDVFKVDWTNMQIGTQSADGRVGYDINGGTVTSEGCEFAATYQVGASLQLAVNASYSDVFATEAVPAVGIVVGTRLPSSPVWTAAATFDYRLRNLYQWTPEFSATWRYVSAQYAGLSTPAPASLAPGYSWVNTDLRMTRGRYEIVLYAKNLLDKRTFNNGGVGLGPEGTGFFFAGFTMEPRTVGLSATVSL